jgi:hypothetical protein
MSLVNEYRSEVRKKFGLQEEDPMATSPTPASTADLGVDAASGMGGMDEATLNSVLELVQKEIAKREAVGEVEPEGMEDPAAKSVQVPAAPGAGAPAPGQGGPAAEGSMKEAEMLADDIYFEMLNSFKNNIANCEDATRKEMYRKGYNHLYKMREKFIKEMCASEEVAPPAAAPVR